MTAAAADEASSQGIPEGRPDAGKCDRGCQKQPAPARRGFAVVDMKLEVVVVPVSDVDPDGNGWFVQEVTTRLPGR